MLLEKLQDYAEQSLLLPPSGFAPVMVEWLVRLTEAGTLVGWVNLREDGKLKPMIMPFRTRGSEIRPRLLCDDGRYVLGVGGGDEDQRLPKMHEAFVQLLKQCAEQTQDTAVKAVLKFIEQWHTQPGVLPDEFKPTDVISFSIELEERDVIPASPHELNRDVEQFWQKHLAGKDRSPMQCLVTGTIAPAEHTMPLKVKGLIGGQAAGVALVSANQPAFLHYGLEQSSNAPMSRNSAEQWGTALNHLLKSPQNRINIGEVTYVFWSKDASMEWLEQLNHPVSTEHVRQLLRSPWNGTAPTEEDLTPLYGVALSANPGRAIVRSEVSTTISAVQQSVGAWFEAQQMIDPYGQPGRIYSLYTLAAGLCRDAKEIKPGLVSDLMECAINGGKLPQQYLDRVLDKVRRGSPDYASLPNLHKPVSHLKAVLIKLILSTQGMPMEQMHCLQTNPEFTGIKLIAYLCGHLVAEVEGAQYAAIGQTNQSLVDNYYATASKFPNKALPRILSMFRCAYEPTLKRKNMGAYLAIKSRVEALINEIEEFPNQFNAHQQGLFALGYYHRRSENRRAAIAKKTEKLSKIEDTLKAVSVSV